MLDGTIEIKRKTTDEVTKDLLLHFYPYLISLWPLYP